MIYSSLAPFYDFIMNHVKYSKWINLIDSITKQFSKSRTTSIFEIGGGTGTLGWHLTKRGYIYNGSDISYNMARLAQTKRLSFLCADARFLPIKTKFDMIIFLYDGINYLQNLDDYKKLFLSVASCLTTRGLFLFDITTATNSFRYFFDHYDFQEFNECSIIRHSYFKPKQSLQINDFTIYSPVAANGSLYKKQTEHHLQKIVSPEQIEAIIPKKIFNCLGIWDGFSMHNFNDNSERIHFLLQLKSL